MNAFWVCLCLSAYGRPFGACCPWQHTRLTAPLFHTRRSRRLPKRAFSDTLRYHYITPLPHTQTSRIQLTASLPTRSSRIPHTTHTSRIPHTTHHAHLACSTHLHTSRVPLTAPNLHAYFADSTHRAQPTHFTHSTHRAPTHFARSTHQAQLTHHARPRATSNHPILCYILHLTVTK